MPLIPRSMPGIFIPDISIPDMSIPDPSLPCLLEIGIFAGSCAMPDIPAMLIPMSVMVRLKIGSIGGTEAVSPSRVARVACA
jgi:hypothetical protein